jgi:hypothetical protein
MYVSTCRENFRLEVGLQMVFKSTLGPWIPKEVKINCVTQSKSFLYCTAATTYTGGKKSWIEFLHARNFDHLSSLLSSQDFNPLSHLLPQLNGRHGYLKNVQISFTFYYKKSRILGTNTHFCWFNDVIVGTYETSAILHCWFFNKQAPPRPLNPLLI